MMVHRLGWFRDPVHERERLGEVLELESLDDRIAVTLPPVDVGERSLDLARDLKEGPSAWLPS